MRAALIALLLLLQALPVLAVEPDEVLGDPALEARARAISKDLRCLVCQNESIDDSDADLAKDLRLLVRERLVAGDSDGEVKAYLVARYGEFVLLKPPFNPGTYLLWALPLLVLGAGGFVVWRRVKIARAVPADAPLSAQEEAALAARLSLESSRPEER